jgi:hypothetical protein
LLVCHEGSSIYTLLSCGAFLEIGWRDGFGEQGVEQAAAGAGRRGEVRLQPVTQRHQRIDLGDDAVLFGEGWERKGDCMQVSQI